jgi:hypothetical protein
MSLHLAEIAARVRPGRHCALLLDQAGWHLSDRLAVPPNITIVPLPAKCPDRLLRKAAERGDGRGRDRRIKGRAERRGVVAKYP